jgi:hypothetical protein
MSTEPRLFNSKKENVPVIAGYVSTNVRRDLAKFTELYPEIDAEYLTGFDARTEAARGLSTTESETAETRSITQKLYTAIDSVTAPLNQLANYVKLAKLPFTATTFGIAAARRKISSRDAEALIVALKQISENISKNSEALSTKGLTAERAAFFTTVANDIYTLNQQQYEAIENRKTIVNSNRKVLNELYLEVRQFCDMGKSIFRGVDALKVKEYTYTELLKRVQVQNKTA